MQYRMEEEISGLQNKKDNETSESFRECLKAYLRNTGCHGCNKLEEGHKIRRWIWSICVSVSLGILLLMLYKELEFYYSYPTITQFDYELMDNANFPAVAICNTCPWSRRKLPSDQKMQDYFASTYFGVFSTNWSDPYYTTNGFFKERTTDDIWNIAIDQDSFIKMVSFDGEILNSSIHIEKTMTNFGPCFTFNSHGRIKTKLDGELFNLFLLLDVNQSDYTWSSTTSLGVKLVIHDPSQTANFDTEGIYVQPGTLTAITVSETRTEFLPYPYQFSKGKYCFDSQLDLHLCNIQCYARYIYYECQCREATDPIDGPICSWYKYQTCWLPMRFKIWKNRTYAEQCICPTPCSSTNYDTSISASQLMSDYYDNKMKSFTERANLNSRLEQIYHKNSAALTSVTSPLKKVAKAVDIIFDFIVSCYMDLIGLHIYFKSLRRTVIRQVSRYATVGEVLANLGGQMGLLLGASILTLTEFIEMLLIMSHILVKRLRKIRLQRSQR